MLDPDSDSLRDRIAVWLRATYEDAVEDATGSTPPEGDWLADADGVLLVLHRFEEQSQRTRPQHGLAVELERLAEEHRADYPGAYADGLDAAAAFVRGRADRG